MIYVLVMILLIACIVMPIIFVDYKTEIEFNKLELEATNETVLRLSRNREYWIKRFKNVNNKLKGKK